MHILIYYCYSCQTENKKSPRKSCVTCPEQFGPELTAEGLVEGIRV